MIISLAFPHPLSFGLLYQYVQILVLLETILLGARNPILHQTQSHTRGAFFVHKILFKLFQCVYTHAPPHSFKIHLTNFVRGFYVLGIAAALRVWELWACIYLVSWTMVHNLFCMYVVPWFGSLFCFFLYWTF